MVAVPFAATEASLKKGDRDRVGRERVCSLSRSNCWAALDKDTWNTMRDNVFFIARDYTYFIGTVELTNLSVPAAGV